MSVDYEIPKAEQKLRKIVDEYRPLLEGQGPQRRTLQLKDWVKSSLDKVTYLTYYWMADTPWSNEICYGIATAALNELFPVDIQNSNIEPNSKLRNNNHHEELNSTVQEEDVEAEYQFHLISEIQSAFKTLKTSSTKRSNSATMNGQSGSRNRIIGGLRPQLGYSNLGSEYEVRNRWKTDNLNNIKAISSLNFQLCRFVHSESDLRKNWHLYVPILLKILDDSDGIVKSMGCRNLSLVLDHLSSSYSASSTSLLSSSSKENYLTKSGLDKEFLHSVSVCYAYIPSLTSSVLQSHVILTEAYRTSIKLITKCSKSRNNEEDALIQLLNDEVLEKVPLVLGLPQSQRVPVLKVYIRVAGQIVDLLDATALLNTSVLVLRKVLWKLVLPLLTDGFLFVQYDDTVNQSSDYKYNVKDFLSNILSFLVDLMRHTSQRIGQYKYDIFAAVIIFVERFNCEVLGDIKLPEQKISELGSETLSHGEAILQVSDDEKVEQIRKLVGEVVQILITSYDDFKVARSEIEQMVFKKPLMKCYFYGSDQDN